MKLERTIVMVGFIISSLGILFHLQGQSIVGPESSFMYANPEWITHGIQIIITGIVIAVIGILLKLIKRHQS